MFSRLMNSYYYGKSGKGDYRKEDLPKNRWQLFWEMLRVRLSGICRLNLTVFAAWIPTMIVLVILINAVASASECTGILPAIPPEGDTGENRSLLGIHRSPRRKRIDEKLQKE